MGQSLVCIPPYDSWKCAFVASQVEEHAGSSSLTFILALKQGYKTAETSLRTSLVCLMLLKNQLECLL